MPTEFPQKIPGRRRWAALLAGQSALAAAFLACGPAAGGEFDEQPAWPLCGRITEQSPPGWTEGDGCPGERFGSTSFSDEPLSSTFGPRPLYSGENRYDFHRGVDIATPVGTPFFAVTSGTVQIAGPDAAYSDPLVRVRHFRPGHQACEPEGCYYSLYLHISAWVVEAGAEVRKGQLLGYTGASSSGFEHLHFEVRDAPSFDPWSAWSRDAVHPLRLLPYSPAGESLAASILPVPGGGPHSLTLLTRRYDLLSVDVEVLDRKLWPVHQPGDEPGQSGYHVHPPFFDMEVFNFQFSHKDSAVFPWERFGPGGASECPFHADHGASYSPHVHLDAQDPADYRRGLFNGIGVRTLRYWPSDEREYEIGLDFLALHGGVGCLEVTATFASGRPTASSLGNCAFDEEQRVSLRVSKNEHSRKVRLSWSGSGGGKFVVYRNGARLPGIMEGKSWTDPGVSAGGRYRYRVCPLGQPARCSHSQVVRLHRK